MSDKIMPGKSMSTPTIVAIYFIIWWVVLFMVLPFGVRSQDESGEVSPGTDPGAPMRHRLRANSSGPRSSPACCLRCSTAPTPRAWSRSISSSAISNPPNR